MRPSVFTPPRSALLILFTSLACSFDAAGLGDEGGPGVASAQAGASTADTDGTAPATTGTSEPNDSGSGTGSAGEGTTEAPLPPGCGDGKLDPGEDCDAGPGNQGGLACTPDCTMNECGDSYVGAGEECDAGAENQSGQICTPACVLNTCGDGYIGAGELCDDGPGNGVDQPCTPGCTVTKCGDGKPGMGEICDDGNTNNSDACLDTCQAATCGDGFQQMNVENCDLGGQNGMYDSGCSLTCTTPGPSCGDGVWDKLHEECEGGGGPQHSGCKGDCKLECDFGWGDCNNDAGDGCEGYLGSKQYCGSCSKSCTGQNSACVFGFCT